MARLVALAAALLLVVAACGGDSENGAAGDNSSEPATTQAATTQPEADDGESDATAPPAADDDGDNGGGDEDGDSDGGDSEGSGPSTATVTLGGETYSFSTEGAIVAQCLNDFFGIVSMQLPMIDDSGIPADGSLQLVILREGTDPDVVGEVNSVRVSVAGEDWVADESDMMYEGSDLLQPGMGQVDSVAIEGRTVRGTATFFRQNSLFTDEVETVTGSFEGTCGEERTS